MTDEVTVEPATIGVAGLRAAIVAILVVAAVRRQVPAAVNAAVVLALALLPDLLSAAAPGGVAFGPALSLWLAAAGLLHAVGMLGGYETVAWWDHLTHAVSAGLLAALAYAGLIVAAPARVPPGGVAAATVLLTFVAGAFWELIELAAHDVGERFDVEPVLVHYGRRDTALDLIVDLAGAIAVVGLDLRLFLPLAERFPRAAGTAVAVGAGTVAVGSVLLGLYVRYGSRKPAGTG